MRRITLLLVALGTLAFAGPAQADGLLSGVPPGLVSPSDTPDVCNTNATQAFSRWNDSNYYVLAPGGAFEEGDTAWKLSGGAKTVRGNEPFYVHDRSDKRSLSLPAGARATSPAMCFATGDWHFRFFVQGSGSVRVTVVVKSLLGVLSTLDGGTVSAGSKWRPSPEVELLLSNVCGILSTDSISVSLTAASKSNVVVDDVYLDPWRSL
jgi:hypothetical protein